MKKLIFTLMLTMLASTIFAQFMGTGYVWLPGEKNQLQPGGKNGKNYAMIAETNGNKKSLIDSTSSFLLKYGWCKNPEEVEKAVKEFSEDASQFTIRLRHVIGHWKSGFYYGDPTMMEYDMRFEFYENGKIMVVFDNFSSLNYVDLASIKKGVDTCSVLTDKEREKLAEYRTAQLCNIRHAEKIYYQGKPTQENSTKTKDLGIVKLRMQTAPVMSYEERLAEYERCKKNVELYFDTKGFFDLIDKDIQSCPNKMWATDEEVLNIVENAVNEDKFKMGGSKYVVDVLKKAKEDGKMFSVPYCLWKTNIKNNFDHLMLIIQGALGAKITGVAEDGEQTWDLYDGELLPVDPKLRAKLMKKDMDYFSYVLEF